jgi:hypothetical protein
VADIAVAQQALRDALLQHKSMLVGKFLLRFLDGREKKQAAHTTVPPASFDHTVRPPQGMPMDQPMKRNRRPSLRQKPTKRSSRWPLGTHEAYLIIAIMSKIIIQIDASR